MSHHHRPLVAALLAVAAAATAGEPAAPDRAFFEKRIRPVLVEHCYACHSRGAKKVRGGLLLDTRDALRQGGDSGPALVPGKANDSLLLRALRHEQELRMPPKGKLPKSVIADFKLWIESGAWDPRTDDAATPRRTAFQISDADRRHWAFQPVADLPVPRVHNERWCRSDIDHFLLARLEARGLHPSAPAERHALLRRATFDLTGLPPTPAEIEAFVGDRSAQAFETVVARLLGSKAFGERWARHWLDGVRYASDVDRAGFYRDWVVRAFNNDLPYDQFVRMQIAGDLLPATENDLARRHLSGASLDGITATGMLALAVWERVGRDLAVAEIVDSQIDLIGRQLMGLTLACARCHDHKFDPLSTHDYYALAGIFFSSHISPGKLIADDRLSGDVLRLPLVSPVDAVRFRAFGSLYIPLTTIGIREGGVPGAKWQKIGDAALLIRGDYQKQGPIVPRRFPEILAGKSQTPLGLRTTGSGRRELAEWITRPDHPLTARVQVNRVWQHLFGEGLVRTPDNFGLLGDRPTHSELLDYLARRFVKDGWSMKRLVRELMLSSAYQQDSFGNPALVRADPDNRLFGRAHRKRLDHESLRDALLCASGQLSTQPGRRRTLYEPIERGRTDAARALFDGADPLALVSKRATTTTAPQALYLMNNAFVAQAAQSLGSRIQADTTLKDRSAQVARAYLLLFGRPPTVQEISLATGYVAERTWADLAQVLVCANEFVYLD